MKLNKKNLGFTLIELITVFAVIGILSTVVMASVNSARSKARDGKRVEELKHLQLALYEYYSDYFTYPTTAMSPNTPYDVSLLATPLAPYILKIPTDPLYCPKGLGGGTCTVNYQYIFKTASPTHDYGLYVNYDNGTFCKVMTAGGDPAWWSNAPLCTWK